jgi:hypothetical protein
VTTAAQSLGALRALAATTAATAAAGAVLAGAAIVGEAPAPPARGAVGQTVGTGFGALAVGTVTSTGRDALRVAVTVTNESAGAIEVEPRRFRLRTARRGAVEPVGGPGATRLAPLDSATLVLRFRAPGAARAGRLEFRDPRGAPLLVDLRRIGEGAAGGGGHG